MVLTLFTMAILGGLFVPLEALPAGDGYHRLRCFPRPTSRTSAARSAAGHAPAALDIAVLAAWTVAAGALAAWPYVATSAARG